MCSSLEMNEKTYGWGIAATVRETSEPRTVSVDPASPDYSRFEETV
jgi:hypothetical protein